jgi:hypothetical protein
MISPEAWLEVNWNRGAFIAFMRRVEILLTMNMQEQAVQAFRQWLGWVRPEPPTLESSVHDILPLRIANTLADEGYETLRAVASARSEELGRVRNISGKSLDLINIAIKAAQEGKRLPEVVNQWACELEPDFQIDWDYFTQFKPKWEALMKYINTSPERLTMSTSMTANVSTETNQLAILLKSIENPDQTVAQIDGEIAKREAELGKLKKLRKLLGAKPAASGNAANFAEVEQKILDAVKSGPLKPKEVKKVIGIDAAHIGRVVARSMLLTKLSDGRVQAKGK